MSAEFFRGAERILSATANGVYQGALVAILAGVALRFFVRTNAATRHAVWFAALLFVAGLIPAHLLLSLRTRPVIQSKVGDSRVISVPSDSLLAGSDDKRSVDESDYADWQSEESGVLNSDSPPALNGGGAGNEPASAETASVGHTDGAARNKGWLIPALALLKRWTWNFETAISLPHWVCLCLVLAWALFAGARLGLIAGRIHDVRRAKRLSEAAGPRLQALFNRLCESLVTGRNVRLRISSAPRSAVVLGFAHPVVLLPAEMDDDANDSEAEHVLRHELAHVQRRDDWSNLAQQFIQAALFFHPAIWWISARLSLEREIACDDYVLEASGRPRAYALTLANFAARMNQTRHLLAPGVSNNNTHLQQRINMILNTKRDRSPRLAGVRLGFFTTATAILAVLAINALPRLVLAQQPGVDPAALRPGSLARSSGQNALVVEPSPAAISPGAIGVVADVSPTGLAPADLAVAVAPLASQPVAVDVAIGDSSSGVGRSWSGADSGPRHKPALVEDEPNPGVAPAPPEPPALPMAPMPPTAPVPVTPPAPHSVKRRLSVEERLDRIERMLEDLQARGTIRNNNRGLAGTSASENRNYYRPDAPYGAPMNPGADFAPKRMTLDAQAAADEARRAVEIGQRAADQARRDIAKLKGQDFGRLQEELRAAESENSTKALAALRDARESLRAQMDTLEAQIKRLEEDRSRLKKAVRNDGADEDPRGQKPAPETR